MAKDKRAEINVFLSDSVSAGAQDNNIFGNPIPAGERWRFTAVGGGDESDGAGAASRIELQVSHTGVPPWKTITPIIIARGGSKTEALSRDIRGDGTRKVRVIRKNNTGSAMVIYAWVKGVKLGTSV